MRLDITDEIRQIANRMNQDPQCVADPAFQPQDVKGAVWAIVALTDFTEPEVLQQIAAARGLTAGAAPTLGSPVVQTASSGPVPPPGVIATPSGQLAPGSYSVASPPVDPAEVVGGYVMPGGEVWPITKWGEDPKPADLSKPPATESTLTDTMAYAQKVGEEQERDAYFPMDDETLAEVEAEMEAAREAAGGQVLPVEAFGVPPVQ